METLFAGIMGIVQGLSEFLPISSSGHLLVAEKLLGLLGYQGGDARIAFYTMLHLGTLLAVALIFWRDWLDMILHPIKNKTLLLLFVASLPALAFTLMLGDHLDRLFEGWFLGISFLITALFLVLIEWLEKRRMGQPRRETVETKDALVMGLFQGIALLPGVSRSGSTLLGGISQGLSRRTAAKFSFMMSAPAILGSFLMELKDVLGSEGQGLGALFSLDILVGTLLAAITGYLAIRYMLRLIERISFYKFALYVAILGLAVILMQLTGFADFPSLLPGALPPA